MHNQINQAFSKEHWLASTDGDRGLVFVDQFNQGMELVDSPKISHFARWLRAHQAIAVALFGRKQHVPVVAAAIAECDTPGRRLEF